MPMDEHRTIGAPAGYVLVGGVPIFDGDLSAALEWCRRRIRNGVGGRVATANLDFLALARKDQVLAADLWRSDLVVADGAPVAALARVAGAKRARRVPGVDLVRALMERHGMPELRVVLYGASEDASAAAAARLAAFEGVTVAARLVPPFRPLSDEEMIVERHDIRAARPDVVLVALGCPKQERLIGRYYDAAPGAIWIGVGGTLDFIAGEKRRAPGWLQALGLEWLARLSQEPGRLWRRYLLRDIPFLVRLTPEVAIRRLRRGAVT